MRIHRSIMLSAAMAIAVAAPSIADSPHPKPGSQSDDVTVECNDTSDPADTISLEGDTLLWPPNHKLVDEVITMTDNDDGDGAAINFVTMTSHDEVVDGEEMNGSGNTAQDSFDAQVENGSDEESVTIQVRAERSGQGDGREYAIEVRGEAGNDMCNADFTILVPHDMRPSNRVKPDNG